MWVQRRGAMGRQTGQAAVPRFRTPAPPAEGLLCTRHVAVECSAACLQKRQQRQYLPRKGWQLTTPIAKGLLGEGNECQRWRVALISACSLAAAGLQGAARWCVPGGCQAPAPQPPALGQEHAERGQGDAVMPQPAHCAGGWALGRFFSNFKAWPVQQQQALCSFACLLVCSTWAFCGKPPSVTGAAPGRQRRGVASSRRWACPAQFVGACIQGEWLLLVTECMAGGDLSKTIALPELRWRAR